MQFLLGMLLGGTLMGFFLLTQQDIIVYRNIFLYHAIDYYTQAQMYYKNHKKYLILSVNKVDLFLNYMIHYVMKFAIYDIEFVRNGIAIGYSQSTTCLVNENIRDDYDFILYTDISQTHTYYNKIKYDTPPSSLEYKTVDPMFIFMEITLRER